MHVGINYPLQSTDKRTKDIEKLIAAWGETKIQRSEYLGITTSQDMDSASKISKVNENIKSITPKYDVTFLSTTYLDLWIKLL